MDDAETDFRAKKLWDSLSPEIRVKFLSYFQFWDGLSRYLYEYLPEEAKDRLRLKIIQNYPYWL